MSLLKLKFIKNISNIERLKNGTYNFIVNDKKEKYYNTEFCEQEVFEKVKKIYYDTKPICHACNATGIVGRLSPSGKIAKIEPNKTYFNEHIKCEKCNGTGLKNINKSDLE